MIDGRYLTDHYPGIGRYIYNLMWALTEAEPKPSVSLLIDPGGRQTRFDLRLLEDRGVSMVPGAGSPRSWRGRIGARRLCRRRAPAVFHATHLFSPHRVACPSVLTVYDVIPLHPAGRLPTVRARFLYRVLLGRALASATRILTLSESARDDLTRWCAVPSSRITVTPAAADPSFRPVPSEQVAALRERLSLPDRYVLYVGTNRPHKNLPRLIEAWARVDGGRHDGCRLLIAGAEDARYPQARRRVQALALETVRFLGPIAEADLPTLYTGARLVVQPSLCEGFGLTVIEAMACGTPVACARVPALEEVSGGAALHFDPASPAEMADAISRGLDDELRAQMASRSLARARQFSWARTAALTLEAYGYAQQQRPAEGRAS